MRIKDILRSAVSNCLLGLTLITMWSLASTSYAVPYASGVSESGSTVTFFLNEDTDSVIINRSGATQLSLGALAKGSHTFPVGGASAYEIVVSKSAAAGYSQISDDLDVGSNFFHPLGVAINQNPSSPHFGNIYVAEGLGGVVSKGGNQIRDTLDGLFVMGADQSDIISQGDGGLIGGLDTGSSNSPFKITIAPDDSVYIADWADATGGVYRAPADLDESSNWPNVLANDNRDPEAGGLTDNHGSIPAVWVEGTGAGTVLYTMDEDWPDASGLFAEGRGDIFRYDIGTSTNFTGAPIVQVDDASTGPGGDPSPAGVILNGLMDFVRDEDGTWWTAQFREDDTTAVPALARWADGASEPLFVSGKQTRTPADFDFDSDVDGNDFLIWQRNIDNDTPTAFTGDANGDGFVDGADLDIWGENYGSSQPAEIVLDGGYGNLDIHDELDLLAMGSRRGQGVYIIDISDPSNPTILDIIPQADRTDDVAFDIAGNVYVTSRSSRTLRIWSPGGETVAVTGSDGSFVVNPPSAVAAVPEPTGLALCLLGLACSPLLRWRRV